MNRLRTGATVVGYVLFGVSVAVLGGSALLGEDSIPVVLAGDLIPPAFFTVAVVGTALVLVLSEVPKAETAPLEVEAVARGRTFGARFDRRLSGWLLVVPERERRTIREELRETALETLVRSTGCSRERTREKLETGAWTDDRVAASFFTPTGSGFRSRTRAIVGRIRFEHRVERTVRALQSIESENE
ncbi:hypothetical protein M0R89_05990 [Halorussus limi]|uniref:Uncharacterized protein n=1 Tax=Halorussus limi TaxID=2938695 RepID=A0A8U0HWZ5_9EURY|nr:hypothetical protein [Halorussus limi]UPV75612.1 hypothetical protein M0R89_05990 [Halorussus limi]